jgi:putative heme-binding domain-containing protein
MAAVLLAPRAQEGPAERLQALPDFRIELVLKADPAVHGSWINLARDLKGRLLLGGQRNQAVTRVTLADGKVGKQEVLKLPVSETMGMLDTPEGLYLSGAGRDDRGRNVFGLFRLRDTQGDGQYDSVEFLREWGGGSGEHGAHGIVLGPDRKLYVVNGNFTAVPRDVLPSSPHRNYADDRILPRAEDGNGFGAGHKPPGGYVLRLDLDGKNPELYSAGQRNAYDIAVNADGEIFGFDSDMEWDWGTPWYRPVRVFHAVSGGDHGFREGSAKWPGCYPDSLPTTVDIGIGSPTGVVFGTGAKFPAKYQKALYILDWSYGRLLAVHLRPQGASYSGSFENFVAPKGLSGNGPRVPLNLTDAVVGADGALYFTVGGRNTAAALYRVSYAGSEPTAPADGRDAEGREARAKRRALETLHSKEDPAALPQILEGLREADRFVRYAARIALERQPVESWNSIEASEPRAALEIALALARVGGRDAQPAVLARLAKQPMDRLDRTLRLAKLRVIQVSVARQGKLSDDAARPLVAELSPLYPSKDAELDTELCQVLLALEAPDAVAKTVGLLGSAPTLEEQISYLVHLRTAARGWTPELRKAYFAWWTLDHKTAGHRGEVLQWFKDAGRSYSDGASLPKFLGNFHAQAKAGLSETEAAALADVLAAYQPPGARPRRTVKARAFVKDWKMEDLLGSLEEAGKDRSFERGKEVYEATQCLLCHKFGAEGGAIGPDLTAIAARFSRRDILESIVDPSKVVSEQYQAMLIRTTDGRVFDGRIVEEDGQKVVVHPNQLVPDKVTLKKSDIERRQPSKVSPMPASLVNVLTKDEILDLLAYVESGGKKEAPAFAALRRAVDVTDRVAAEVRGNRLSIAASNELFGDPAQGVVKRLRVDYLDGEEARSRTVDENATLEVRATEGRKLVIKRALYGVLP